MAGQKDITVFVAEESPYIRRGVTNFLSEQGFHLIGESDLAQEAVSLCAEKHPDVVILGLKFQGDTTAGVEAVRQITRANGSKVIVLGDDFGLIENARRAGAFGSVSLTTPMNDLVKLVQLVPQLKQFSVSIETEEFVLPEQDALTSREEEVLVHLAGEGQSVREIARDLGIAPSTVKNHVQSIYSKLQVSNRAEVVRRAMELGLVN